MIEIDIRAGDVLLYSGRSLLSWAIRFRTFSFVSHAELFAGWARDIPTLLAEGWSPQTPVTITAGRRSLIKKAWWKFLRKPRPVGDGVDYYPFDADCLAYVMRPAVETWDQKIALSIFESPLDEAAMARFEPRRHCHYDTVGLLQSFYGRRFRRKDDAAFCSEITRWASEWGGVYGFAETLAHDATPPCAYRETPVYREAWRRGA